MLCSKFHTVLAPHVIESNIHIHAHKIFANICGNSNYANSSHNKFFINSLEVEMDFPKTFVKQ